jgi:hypothetical protein
MSERTQKLVSIRQRTDQDLLTLINRELDRGFALVNLATRNSPHVALAGKACRTAAVMLPRISSLAENDRLCIEARVKELRCRLDQVSTLANARVYPESVAS